LTKKNLCGALGAADPVPSQPGAPVPGQPQSQGPAGDQQAREAPAPSRNSVKFGRPRVLDGFQRKEALRRREALSLIAQSYRLSAKTISRL
jgi:hypothetical protein